jgi:7,8-dihydropterin-6-yl-methyl-4-(beta-D-ribofuranosyl)aminobenzene 5'-phosphate synthase
MAGRKIFHMSIGHVDSLTVYTLAEDYTGYDSLCWASFGISFLLRIESGGGMKSVLFDTASDAEPVLHNMALLQLSPEEIDLIVLSHRHFDHTGGLAGIVREIGREDVPIIAHPNIFDATANAEPYMEPSRSRIYLDVGLSGENRKERVESSGGRWWTVRDPFPVAPGVITTGEIREEEKIAYEKNPRLNILDIKDGRAAQASVLDDISLCICIDDGLVIVTGCSHAGIVSIAKKAMRVTGIDRIISIIGGFHLCHADDDVIERTVRDLESMKIDRIYSGHCTGVNAENRLRQVLKDKFQRLHSGRIITFPAQY